MPDILKQRPKSDVPQAVAVMTRWTEQDPSSGEESEGRTTQITREESANLQPLPQALLCTVLPGPYILRHSVLATSAHCRFLANLFARGVLILRPGSSDLRSSCIPRCRIEFESLGGFAFEIMSRRPSVTLLDVFLLILSWR
ncbi:unnamed protein product [Polarella glacialis]|uniref:Uncharacterized protein n=1 Tax=Polarella glacialis TaxID=89957 RepID=A0A813DN39_POLGL|nr:unnamed protein product [Polarella glacialis]